MFFARCLGFFFLFWGGEGGSDFVSFVWLISFGAFGLEENEDKKDNGAT